MRNKILIVDSDEQSIVLFKNIFESEYTIITAKDGKEGLVEISHNVGELAIIFLGLNLPVVGSLQLLQVLSAREITNVIPVIIIAAEIDTPTALSYYTSGAVDIYNRPFVPPLIQKKAATIIELYKSREVLEAKFQKSKEQIIKDRKRADDFYEHITDAVGTMAEFRNLDFGSHIKRIKGIVKILGQSYMQLNPNSGLNKETLGLIIKSVALHDIGMLAIPDSVLLKPGKLTSEETELIKSHCSKGCELLSLFTNLQGTEQYKISMEICKYHHERYDGKGYPNAISGDDIPISAQLVSVAEVYEALVSNRVYREAYNREDALNMVLSGHCGAFSPKIIECFNRNLKMINLFLDSNR